MGCAILDRNHTFDFKSNSFEITRMISSEISDQIALHSVQLNKTHFHKKDFKRGLVLEQKPEVTPKWPIAFD